MVTLAIHSIENPRRYMEFDKGNAINISSMRKVNALIREGKQHM